MLSRRQFIGSSGSLISMASLVPTMLCRAGAAAPASRDDRVLVVIQLDGGNDGLSTVVPYADDAYARVRPKLRIAAKDVHKLTDSLGLHPRMRPAKELFDDGRLTIVQGVGYPNPDRSHFKSMRIWQTASFDDAAHNSYGWLGRALDGANDINSPSDSAAVFVGEEQVPVSLWGRRSSAVALARIDDLTLDREGSSRVRASGATTDPSLQTFVTQQVLSAHSAADKFEQRRLSQQVPSSYPDTALANRLKLISQLLKSGSAARVFYTIHSGYDTHAAQQYRHGQLLADFSQALKAFLDDLDKSELSQRVVVLAFSEFGRRVAENDSLGTDHGAAGPVFLAGKPVRGGIEGATPRLDQLVDGDLPTGIDFRRIYATLLDEWLSVNAANVLGEAHVRLKLLDG
jgi:uncharacterized protein (DUF1501 family)